MALFVRWVAVLYNSVGPHIGSGRCGVYAV